jgi:hypothetical protein
MTRTGCSSPAWPGAFGLALPFTIMFSDTTYVAFDILPFNYVRYYTHAVYVGYSESNATEGGGRRDSTSAWLLAWPVPPVREDVYEASSACPRHPSLGFVRPGWQALRRLGKVR